MGPHFRSVSVPASPHARGGAQFLNTDVIVGVAARNLDELPQEDLFCAWTRTRRANIYWEGPGGIAHIERDDVRRVTLASSDEGQAGGAPRRVLTSFMEEAFQVPSSIPCDRICVTNYIDAMYVTQMSAYLFRGEGPLPSMGTSSWVAEFKPSRVMDNGELSREYKQNRLAFFLSQKAGRVVTIEDWLALRTDRHTRRQDSFDMDAEVSSLLRIPLEELPNLPDLVGRLRMPAGIPVVMPPVLKFFAAEVTRCESSAVGERFHTALESEVKRGVINALGAEYYWTGRIIKLGAPLMGQLRDWDREGVPVLRVIDRYDADPLHPRDLLRRAELAQGAPDNKLFTRRDYVTGDSLVWALEGPSGGLSEAVPGRCGHGGHPLLSPKISRGRPAQIEGGPIEVSLNHRVVVRDILGESTRIGPVLGALASKPRISIREFVQRVASYCGRPSRWEAGPDREEFERMQNHVRAAESDLKAARDEIADLRRELRGWQDDFRALARGPTRDAGRHLSPHGKRYRGDGDDGFA